MSSLFAILSWLHVSKNIQLYSIIYCEVGRVVGVCASGEKGGQEDNDKTKRRHGRISNRDRNSKMASRGVTRQERVYTRNVTGVKWKTWNIG